MCIEPNLTLTFWFKYLHAFNTWQLLFGKYIVTRSVQKVFNLIIFSLKQLKNRRCPLVDTCRGHVHAWIYPHLQRAGVIDIQSVSKCVVKACRICISCKICKMIWRLVQQYYIKFCQKLGDIQIEYIHMIQQAFSDGAINNTQINDGCLRDSGEYSCLMFTTTIETNGNLNTLTTRTRKMVHVINSPEMSK